MSITLFCLVKGNTTANAFSVKISRDEPISELKKAIKAEKHKTFHGEADGLKLWKVEISGDHVDPLSNLTLQDQTELLAINDIGGYWPTPPPKKHIHVLVEPPETTVTSSREQESLEEVASLRALINKSVHNFEVVVGPKRTKGFKWNVNIEDATLEGLKGYIRKMDKPPALENDGAVLKFISDGERYSPQDDQDLRKVLRLFVSKNNLKFTVFIETPSKPFSEWTFPKVCELYGLSDDPNPDFDVYPIFQCGSADLNSEKSKAMIEHLMAELDIRIKTTPLSSIYETKKTFYSYCYLAGSVSLYDNNFKIVPEKLIKGYNGQGNLDLAVECRSTGRIAGLVEVKREDFKQGFSQASVQMESSLTCRRRKVNELGDENDMDKVWGIVTDVKKWYFMECMLDNNGKPSFKLSEPVIVDYQDESMQTKVKKVLGHIVWLLEEAQKSENLVEDLRSVKKIKSTGKPSNTETN